MIDLDQEGDKQETSGSFPLTGGMKKGWSAKILLKYILLQIPAAGLLVIFLLLVQKWMTLSSWLVGGVIGLWIAKDVVLFPFVWRSYAVDRSQEGQGIFGMVGLAKEKLNPSGYVQVRGELWQADLVSGGRPIEKGDIVKVRGVDGIKLLVEGVNEEKEINDC
ncbi:NfeD family protein [Thermodesulfobacteriota bacterium]